MTDADIKVTLDNVEISTEELQEKKNSLSNSERIVEVKENTYETVTRMNG